MENKNGQGIFYGVIGVATLIVAIIGATFAYFSASVNTGNSTISGQTLGGSGSVLGLTVTPVWNAVTNATSFDLVPTNISTNTDIIDAIGTSKCEATSGVDSDTTVYTGCHLYAIHATTGNSAVNGATLEINQLETTNSHSNEDKWHYALFEVTGTVGSNVTAITPVSDTALTNGIGDFNVTSTSTKIINNQNLTANYDKTFYLLIYVENEETTQNAGDSSDVTGSYYGEVTFSTASGSTVKATFNQA